MRGAARVKDLVMESTKREQMVGVLTEYVARLGEAAPFTAEEEPSIMH
jgi:hypothetical protein